MGAVIQWGGTYTVNGPQNGSSLHFHDLTLGGEEGIKTLSFSGGGSFSAVDNISMPKNAVIIHEVGAVSATELIVGDGFGSSPAQYLWSDINALGNSSLQADRIVVGAGGNFIHDWANPATGALSASGGGNVDFEVQPGGLAVFDWGGLGLGDVTNSGAFSLGSLHAGDQLVVDSYSQNTGAGIAIYLSSTTSDQLAVGGTASLVGNLDLFLIGGTAPAIGGSIDILSYSVLVGAFELVSGTDMGNGSYLALRYGANALTIQVQLDGDLNGDGFVGIDDLNLVLINWNQTVPAGSPLNGDLTGDGFVGVDDLNLVLVNWNNSVPPGQQGASIPEPGTLGLLTAGLSLLCRRPKRTSGKLKHAVKRSRTMRGQTGLAAVMLALFMGVSPTMSAVLLGLVPIDNSAQLTGYTTYDLQATTDTDWTASVMLFEPTAGSIYQHPQGFDGLPTPVLIPILYPQYPEMVFDTYFIGTGAGGAGDLDRSSVYAFNSSQLSAAWFNTDKTDIGMTTIGRLTLTDDTAGTMSVMLTSVEGPALFDVTFAPEAAPVVSLVIQQQAAQENNTNLWIAPALQPSEPIDNTLRLNNYLYAYDLFRNKKYDSRRDLTINSGMRWRTPAAERFNTVPEELSTLPEPGMMVLIGAGGLVLLRRGCRARARNVKIV